MFSGGQRQRIAIARALDAAAEAAGRRRAGLRARCFGAGAGAQPAGRSAAATSASPISSSRTISAWCATSRMTCWSCISASRWSRADKERIFAQPLHPYTQALLASTPGLGAYAAKHALAKGELPSPLDPPKGCVFSTRCPYVTDLCRAERPPYARSMAAMSPAIMPSSFLAGTLNHLLNHGSIAPISAV